jgi:serine/threonine protein phosphatase PrpC
MGTEDKALFGVFDGHGGREVAVFCNEKYEGILNNTKDSIQTKGE